MTKTDLIRAIAEKHDLSVSVSGQIIDSALQMISESLEHGEAVRLRGFGNFTTRNRPPRKGRSLKTGLAIHIPEKRVVTFKPGARLNSGVERAGHLQSEIENLVLDLEEVVGIGSTREKASKPDHMSLLLSHLSDVQVNTTFLWRRLKGLKLGETTVSCEVRDMTFMSVVENLNFLSESKLFKFDTEKIYNNGGEDILNLRLYQISPELREYVQQLITAD
ncbi:MAG: HU family DNA-binding protein [Magnetococcales bacterium]|nr:HU family DNA-binding protein [Magnetococcales bacterium]